VRELAPGITDERERNELLLQACVQLFTLGWRMGGSEEESKAVFAEGRSLAEKAGDRPALARLIGFYGLMQAQQTGSALDYVRYGEEAAEIAAECDDPALRAAIGTFPAFGNFYVGDGRATLKWADRVLAETGSDDTLGKEIAGYGPRAAMIFARARAFIDLGRLEEAKVATQEANRVAEASGELEVLSWAKFGWAGLAYVRGGPESGLEHAQSCLEIAEELDNESSRAIAYWGLGTAYLVEAQPRAACEALGMATALIRDRSVQRGWLPTVMATLAEAHVVLGEPAEAMIAAREAIDLASVGGNRYPEALAHIVLAGALLLTEGAVPRAEIESALERADDLVESIAAGSLSPRILEMRGRIARALGDKAASDRALHEALDLYRGIGAEGHADRLARELGA
jgi:tetratricopeptide (TPR) repeat protein